MAGVRINANRVPAGMRLGTELNALQRGAVALRAGEPAVGTAYGDFLLAARGARRVAEWGPLSGTGMYSYGGPAPTIGATASHPALSVATLAQSLYRTRFATSTTAGNAAGARDNVAHFTRGASAGRGGFFARFRFCTGDISLAGGQKFIGVSANTAALAGEPSALVNSIGVIKDSGDTQLHVFARGASAQTKTPLIAIANNLTFDLIIYAPSGDTQITVKVLQHDYAGNTTEIFNSSALTTVPAPGVFLGRRVDVRNGATAAADNVELVRAHLELPV